MHLSPGLCILLAAVISINGTSFERNQNYSTKERMKRGFSALLRIILTNAKPYISTETVRVFAKYGDIKQAERDFLSLQPVKIRDFGFFTEGKVGLKKIELDSSGNNPSLSILTSELKLNGEKIQTETRIIYFKKDKFQLFRP